MKVAIYIREKDSHVEEIKRTLELKVRSFGWDIVRIYVDENANGVTLNREGLKQMFSDAEKSMFEFIVVTGIEKLSRKMLDLKSIGYFLSKHHIHVIELGGKVGK